MFKILDINNYQGLDYLTYNVCFDFILMLLEIV